MKKILAMLLAVALMITTLAGCNYQLFDTTYTFDCAVVRLPNGDVIEGEVQAWTDYEGDQIQVKIDGVTYLVHASNITLIAE